MPPGDPGRLVKLTISPVAIDEAGKVTIKQDPQDPKFEVMLNPSSYNHQYTIVYDQTKALGQIRANPKFSAIGAEKVSFDIVLDGTGVTSPGRGSPDVTSVPSRIRELNTVVYQYDGNSHEPNHVRLLWSTLIFFGRLDSMSVDYTLFKPSGEPLRAKVTLNFVGFMSKEEQALQANRSSPDLSLACSSRRGTRCRCCVIAYTKTPLIISRWRPSITSLIFAILSQAYGSIFLR